MSEIFFLCLLKWLVFLLCPPVHVVILIFLFVWVCFYKAKLFPQHWCQPWEMSDDSRFLCLPLRPAECLTVAREDVLTIVKVPCPRLESSRSGACVCHGVMQSTHSYKAFLFPACSTIQTACEGQGESGGGTSSSRTQRVDLMGGPEAVPSSFSKEGVVSFQWA